MIVTKREHACLSIEHEGAALVIDPGSFTEAFTVENLAGVVVTHEHPDHVTPEHLHRLLDSVTDVEFFAPAGVAAAFPDFPWQIVSAGDARTAGSFSLAFSGGRHAEIHSSIPLIDNVGVLVNGLLYYPGDSFTVPEVDVDTLAVPGSAPWLKIGEVMDYVDTVKPRRVFATHDMIYSEAGNRMAAVRIARVAELHGGEFVALRPGDTLVVG